jgi:hypothetical protein
MGRKSKIKYDDNQVPLDFEDPEFFDDKNLSLRQVQFCQEYAITQNATQSYLKVYYPHIKTPEHLDYKRAYNCAKTNGPKLIAKTGIKDTIRTFLRQRAIKNQVSADYILYAAKQLVDRGLGDIKPHVDPQTGKETGEYSFDSSSVDRGLKVLMKHSSVSSEFTEKIEVQTSEKVSQKLSTLQASLRKKRNG